MATPQQRWNDMKDQLDTIRLYLDAKVEFNHAEWQKTIIGACNDIIFDAKKISKADFGKLYTK